MKLKLGTSVTLSRAALVIASICVVMFSCAMLMMRVPEASAEVTSGDGWHYEEGTKTLVINGALTNDWELSDGAPWRPLRAQIQHVKILAGAKAKSCSYMFYSMSNLQDITGLNNLDTSSVQYMRAMFDGDSSLTSINVSGLNTSNVTYMDNMFSSCSSLTSLDLSSLNTSKVVSMGDMFFSCSSLRSLNLSNFNTSNVTDMYWMFHDCTALSSLDLSSFNTSKVQRMDLMFCSCKALTSLDLSNFNTSQVVTMSRMFCGCSSLTSLNVSNFNTGNVKNMNAMFEGCSALESLDISTFDVSSATLSPTVPGSNTNLACIDMFDSMPSCKQYKLGPKFAFKGYIVENGYEGEKTLQLPQPPSNDRYNGKWTSNVANPSGSPQYTPAELRDAYSPTLAGTYVWAENTPVSYTVVFQDRNGNAIGEPQTVLSGTSAVAPTPPSIAGWTFTGWDKDFTNVQGDLVVRAQYQQNIYVVTYNANEHGSFGTNNATTLTKQKHGGESFLIGDTGIVSETSRLPRKIALDACGGSLTEGASDELDAEDVTTYTFVSWNTDSNGGGTAFAEGASYDANANLTLYAQWAPHVESLSDPLPAATREGYALDGWYDAETDGQRVGGAGDCIATDAEILYARWNRLTYSVRFLVNGTPVKEEQVAHGDAATAPDANSMDLPQGQTFKGWDKAFDAVTSDLEINAILAPAPVPSAAPAPESAPATLQATPTVSSPAAKPANTAAQPLVQTGDDIVPAVAFLTAASTGLIAMAIRRGRA